LISHKLKSEQANIQGVDECVTAQAIRAAIEKDFAGDTDFMALWPESMPDESLESWVGRFQTDDLDYNWPAAPNGGSYRLVLVS
jgi:hypothetical protein